MTTQNENRIRRECAVRGVDAQDLAPRERHAKWSAKQDTPEPLNLLAAQVPTLVPELGECRALSSHPSTRALSKADYRIPTHSFQLNQVDPSVSTEL